MDRFDRQIAAMHERLTALKQRAAQAVMPDQGLLVDALANLSIAFEELQVVGAELQQQHEELLETRQDVEAERQRYRDLFAFAPEAYLVTTLHGVIQEANHATATLLNTIPTLLVGVPLISFIVADARQSFLSVVGQLHQSYQVVTWETCLQPQNGVPIDVGVRAATMRDWYGAPLAIRWLLQDITVQKRMENAQRFLLRDITALKHMEEAQRFLADAGAVLATSLETKTMLEIVAHLAIPFFCDCCVVDVCDSQGSGRAVAVAHVDPTKEPFLRGFWYRYQSDPAAPSSLLTTLRMGLPILLPQVPNDTLYLQHDPGLLTLMESVGIAQSAIVAPLIARGQTIGVMAFAITQSTRQYGSDDLALAEELARRIALAVDNAYRYDAERHARQAAERAADRIARLQEVTAALAAALTPDQIATVVVEHGVAALGASVGTLVIPIDDGSDLEIVGAVGVPPEVLDIYRHSPLTAPILATNVIRRNEPIWVESLDSIRAQYSYIAAAMPLLAGGALAAIPLTVDGQVLGSLTLGFTEAQSFPDEDRDFALALAQQGAQALQRARLYTSARQELVERTRAEQALRRSEEQLRTIIQAAPIAIIVLDTSGAVHMCNAAAERLFGWQQHELLGLPLPIHSPEQQTVFQTIFARLCAGETVSGVPITGHRRNGTPFEILFSAAPLHDTAGTISNMILLSLDVTELEEVRASRARLKILSQRLLEAQETERREIARELHDEIGQSLTAVQLNLQAMQSLSILTELPMKLVDSQAIIERVLQQVRAFSLDLHPSFLDDFGLAVALPWYVERQAERAGLVAEVNIAPLLQRPPTMIETACFRIVQEAVTNCIRHAQATTLSVELWQQAGNLHLLVQDDGVGFDSVASQQRALRGESIGLLGMQERATLIGGTCDIHAVPGEGTTIHTRFPLNERSSSLDVHVVREK